MIGPGARSPRSGALAVFALASVLALASAARLLPHFGTWLPSDLGDPILGSWILWWNAHAVPFTAAWWNAPMFAPMPGTFAMAEALLSLAPLSTPLQWAGVNSVAAHNALYLLSYPMAAVGAYVLAFKITKRKDAALLAALAFAFNPYRIAQLPHIQVQWSCWMPLALAALHDYVTTHRRRALLWFALSWTMNGFTNGYFLVYFPLLVGIWMLWFVRRWRDAFAIGAAAVVASLPILPLLIGYAVRQRAFGFSRSISEIRTFGADLFAIFSASPRAWLSTHWTLPPGPEGELYPGLVLLVLTVIGVVFAWRRRGRNPVSTARRVLIGLSLLSTVLAIAVMISGGSELHFIGATLSVHRPSRLLTFAFWFGVIALGMSPSLRGAWRAQSVLAFYLIAAGVMYFFALGPEPRAGATQILYKPPYTWLMYLPGFDSVRVPARFGLLTILCLTQVGALVWARLVTGATLAKLALARLGLVSLAILAEGWIVMPVVALPAPLEIPAKVSAAGAVVVELPVRPSFQSNTIALYNQMHHGRPIANGFSGYLPPHYYALYLALDNLDVTAFDALRASGPVAVFVDSARDQPTDDPEPNPPGAQLALVSRVEGAELLERTARGTWFLLPGRPAPADPVSSGNLLTPSTIAVTSTPDFARALTDGVPATRWHGAIKGEAATDTITLSFDDDVRPDVIEVDQGNWAGSYARDFEIVFATAAGDVRVFRGSLAAPAILGALKSKHAVIRIPIVNAPPTRTIRLICHPPAKKFTWSVGEIKVFGRK